MNNIAIDLGATSGRIILATVKEDGVEYRELSRFNNYIIEVCGHSYWDIYVLFREITSCLKTTATQGIHIDSIGIDTWGVDFVCIGKDGAVLRNPLSYRDPHTNGMSKKFFSEKMSVEELYMKTGVQIMEINSLFQFYAMRNANDSALEAAEKILFMPDALSYMLTNEMVCEYTIASTSQLMNPWTRDFDETLLASVGLRREQFGRIVYPGTVIGNLSPEIQQMTGLGEIPVVAVAGHDTASAVASISADTPSYAFLSSGTWSLMGIVVQEPIVNEQSMKLNFTNEGGVDGTICFLKNITGMWILERCRAEWQNMGRAYSYDDIMKMFAEATDFTVFDPDDNVFANPFSMLDAIFSYCKEHGLRKPSTDAEVVKSIFKSLVCKYKTVFDSLQSLAPFSIEKLYVIGGGARNTLLNHLVEETLGVSVVVGDTEATSIGNVKYQN